MKKLSRKHLVEIFIAAMLIMILAVVMIPRFLQAQKSNKVAVTLRRLHAIQQAVEQVGYRNLEYPPSTFKIVSTQQGTVSVPVPQQGGLLYLINQELIEAADVYDPFLVRDETVSPVLTQWLFVEGLRGSSKFSRYRETTNRYRGELPGEYTFLVGSVGPDGMNNFAPAPQTLMDQMWNEAKEMTPEERVQYTIAFYQKYDVFLDYDSSNGVFSDGDIFVLGQSN